MGIFQKAVKLDARVRMLIYAPSGFGKTMTGIKIGKYLVDPEARVAVIDTERNSSNKYAHLGFDVVDVMGLAAEGALPKPGFHPDNLIYLLSEAAKDHDVIVVDALSAFWNQTGGLLELVDDEVKRMSAAGRKGDSFAAWKSVDVLYRKMIQAILLSPCHVICCSRAKQEYEKVDGKVKKLGMAAELRDSAIFEFDIQATLDAEHNLIIEKTRCEDLDGRIFHKAGADVAKIIRAWLSDGAKPAAPKPAIPPPAPTTTDFNKNHWVERIASADSLDTLKDILDNGIRKLAPEHQKELVGAWQSKKTELSANG